MIFFSFDLIYEGNINWFKNLSILCWLEISLVFSFSVNLLLLINVEMFKMPCSFFLPACHRELLFPYSMTKEKELPKEKSKYTHATKKFYKHKQELMLHIYFEGKFFQTNCNSVNFFCRMPSLRGPLFVILIVLYVLVPGIATNSFRYFNLCWDPWAWKRGNL